MNNNEQNEKSDNKCANNEPLSLRLVIKNKIPVGTLYIKDKTIEFDPRTLICDLTYNPEISFSNLDKHFYYSAFEYEKEFAFDFNNPIYIADYDRDRYTSVISFICKMIIDSEKSRKPINLKYIELMRIYYDFSLELSLFKTVPNIIKIPKFTRTNNIEKDIDSIVNPKGYYTYIPENKPIRTVAFSYNNYNLNDTLSINYLDYDEFFYQCFSLSEIVFSVLHFLAINGYKVARCRHCEKYFATLTLKQDYCYRKSQYKGFSHLECSQAVKNIKQKLRRNRRTIAKNLKDNQFKKYEDFKPKSKKLINKVVKHPTPKNIDNAFEYINKDRWYIRNNKKK